ncbi:3-dehydroquinate dehydratase [Candidatus Providencia siddallii]|uniref:3-dehydroquinate dehydratase n=1 Tax=Candidatus Providencia siddallii TaxID=1715285 RepID=A0A0M6W6V5_9GAMM|nr:3-dehydroquinate dehydratase [Candidatus Providencia siddallii]
MIKNTKILLLNGPNLNLLGIREPDKYGNITLSKIIAKLTKKSADLNVTLNHFQSNAEHQLIDRIHTAQNNIDFILINPSAFTHTSIALRDAILSVCIPYIEIHITNIYAREIYRQNSYFSDKAIGIICGLGADGYLFALQAAVNWIRFK